MTRTNQPVLRDEYADAIAVLTLNRPQQRNSLTEELLDALTAAIEQYGSDPSCRVIVLAAEGHAFCAGHDIKQLTAARQHEDGGKSYFQKMFSKSSRLMSAITRCPKPVVAKVQGMTSAAGCQIVASADLALAAQGAQFVTPGVDIGLFCSTPMVAVSRNIPRKHMMEMLLLGDTMDAAKAQSLGLVNHVVDADALDEETQKLAARIAAKPAGTVARGKQAFYRQIEQPIEDAYALTQKVMVENMLDDEAIEGLGAFLDKRKPEWPGR